MTSLTRFYKSRANLTDHDVSKVLQRFTRQLMLNKKALTPEMQELVKEISDMSSKVLYTQSAFDKLIDGTGDASYVSTVIIVGLAIAHWISPKVAAEAEDALKMVSLRMGEFAKGLGQFANESKITVGAGGAVSVLPEVIGNAMGLSTESSKKLIASTVNDLTKATINFQKQIDFIADGRSQLDPNKR